MTRRIAIIEMQICRRDRPTPGFQRRRPLGARQQMPLMRQLIQSGLMALETRLAVFTLASVPVQVNSVASISRRGRDRRMFTAVSPARHPVSPGRQRRRLCRTPPIYRRTPRQDTFPARVTRRVRHRHSFQLKPADPDGTPARR